jgi:hypothetical protein
MLISISKFERIHYVYQNINKVTMIYHKYVITAFLNKVPKATFKYYSDKVGY